MEGEYDEIYSYLSFGQYPLEFTKNQKRMLRRRATDNYCVKNGLLYYQTKKHEQVVRTQQDINRILRSCHDSLEGNNYYNYIIIIIFYIIEYMHCIIMYSYV